MGHAPVADEFRVLRRIGLEFRVLRRVRGIATTYFTSSDVVRHPLVARIVEAYDAARLDA